MFQQCILIAIKAVLRYLQRHRRPEEGNAVAPRFYQVRHAGIGPHIVVDYHAARVHARTYSIIEHQWHAGIHQLLEMLIVLRILGLRHNDATYLFLVEPLTDIHLALVLLLTRCYEYAIATFGSLFLNTSQH